MAPSFLFVRTVALNLAADCIAERGGDRQIPFVTPALLSKHEHVTREQCHNDPLRFMAEDGISIARAATNGTK